MNNRLAGEFLQVALSNQSTNRRRGNWLSFFINHKAAISVSVKGKSDVCALLDDEFLQVHEVLRIQWISFVVREGAVQLEKQWTDIERQLFKNRRYGMPAHAIG